MIARRYVVVPAIVVLTLAADIAVRLLDSGAPGQSVPPAVAGPPPSAPEKATPVSPPFSTPPGWSPSFSATSGISPSPRVHAGVTSASGARPGVSLPGVPQPTTPPPDGRTPEEEPPGGKAPDGRPQTASLDDLLERDDQVPEGVAEQLDFFSGGGTDCQTVSLQPPLDVDVSSNRTVPGIPYICLLSTLDDDLRVTLATPSGSVLTVTRPWAGGSDEIPLPLAPGSPPGRYRVSVQQGKNPEKATTEFVVEPAREPTVQIFPRVGFPGSTVQVYLGGFPAGRADLHLYAFEDPTERPIYKTTHTVTVDAAGTAYLILQTSTFTRPTYYALVSDLYFADRPDGVSAPEAYAGLWLR
ncbi:hypothetical protein [Actinoplanes aureus]|uniref:Uncharacterized protein n=1 Tax=Actinoplanes aureus TaxID=2792083 RepID=A0A931CKE2_9ACTN|nr:hypothetical protein [Actinoplanes aureus]MBG0568031.1 hypothetical protein [Actinoplanes aureus]